MLDRNEIEKILNLNGVAPTASDEQIKSVLVSAQWHKDDIETAVLVLRENLKNKKTHVDTVRKVFHSDEPLNPELIYSLLGIEMNVTRNDITLKNKRRHGNMRPIQIMYITLFSFTLSLVFVVLVMWYMRIGIFYIALV